MNPDMVNAFFQQMVQQNPYLMQSYLQFVAAQNNAQAMQHQQNAMVPQQNLQAQNQPTNDISPTKNLYGRMIESLEEVVPKEIPMDKTPAIFPTKDLSAVYVTSWDNNFQLQKIRYIPEQIISGESEKNGGETVLDKIMQRLDQIEVVLTGQSKKTAQNDAKKKVNIDKEVSE